MSSLHKFGNNLLSKISSTKNRKITDLCTGYGDLPANLSVNWKLSPRDLTWKQKLQANYEEEPEARRGWSGMESEERRRE